MKGKELIDYLENKQIEIEFKLNDGINPYYVIGSLNYFLELAITELKKRDMNEK